MNEWFIQYCIFAQYISTLNVHQNRISYFSMVVGRWSILLEVTVLHIGKDLSNALQERTSNKFRKSTQLTYFSEKYGPKNHTKTLIRWVFVLFGFSVEYGLRLWRRIIWFDLNITSSLKYNLFWQLLSPKHFDNYYSKILTRSV